MPKARGGPAVDDPLTGSQRAESLRGSSADEILYGGVGNDVLYGDAGNDLLDGGASSDAMYRGGIDNFMDANVCHYTINFAAGSSKYTWQQSSSTGGSLQSFTGEPNRRRLSAVAVTAVLRVIDAWRGSNAEGAALLGVSESTWDRMKAGKWDGSLSQDQLTRASALIGVFKGLHLLFADGMADRWPALANRGPVFDRMTPIQAMIEGGIPRMLEVRQYIDALRGGL